MAEFFDLLHHADLNESSSSGSGKHFPQGGLRDGPRDKNGVVTSRHTKTLPITGQGTIVVQSNAESMLSFTVKTEDENKPTLHLIIGTTDYQFYSELHGDRTKIPVREFKGHTAAFLNGGKDTKYWLSIDKENGLLRYGKYSPTKALTVLEARLKKPTNLPTNTVREGWEYEVKKVQLEAPKREWTDPQWEWIGDLKTFDAEADQKPVPTLSIAIGPLPVVIDLAPFVADPAKITLTDLESGHVVAPVNLPLACQELYGNIQGVGVTLEDDEFPSFADAIQRSIITPGCWAHDKLREKARQGEFAGGLAGTYLRITLGYNQGNSPGIPYVMEIWPSGHYSPIHNHGQACAVIRVLHGEITCSWYASLQPPTQMNGDAPIRKGQVTWISPKNYQIHKLENRSHGVCVTIQCYRYDATDNVHYDGFDFINGDKVEKFVPDSDMAFIDFRNKMLEEWKAPILKAPALEAPAREK